MVQINKKRYRRNWQVYTVIRLFVKDRVNILTMKNAIKMIILIAATILVQIEIVRVKGHWIAGGNVAFPFLMAMMLWYVPNGIKEFMGSCKRGNFKGGLWNSGK